MIYCYSGWPMDNVRHFCVLETGHAGSHQCHCAERCERGKAEPWPHATASI